MACLRTLVCLVALCVSVTEASLCALLANGGQCVKVDISCPYGKRVNSIFSCHSPEYQCCYSSDDDPPITTPYLPTPPLPTDSPACGDRSRMGLIFNGKDVGDACKWPWVVSVRVLKYGETGIPLPSNTNNRCNGVLVSPDVVLTSANCLSLASVEHNFRPAAESLLVVAGEYNSNAYELFGSGLREQFHSVKSAIAHPNFYQPDETLTNILDLTSPSVDRQSYNIAALKLDYPVVLGGCRELACLPTVDQDLLNVGSYSSSQVKQCYVASWGAYSSTNNNPSLTLKEAKVELLPQWVCNQINYNNFATNGTTCGRVSYGSGTGICQGDDGGMVVCQDDITNKWKLYGLLNFPFFQSCSATGDNLLTFTDIRDQTVLNWINQQLV